MNAFEIYKQSDLPFWPTVAQRKEKLLKRPKSSLSQRKQDDFVEAPGQRNLVERYRKILQCDTPTVDSSQFCKDCSVVKTSNQRDVNDQVPSNSMLSKAMCCDFSRSGPHVQGDLTTSKIYERVKINSAEYKHQISFGDNRFPAGKVWRAINSEDRRAWQGNEYASNTQVGSNAKETVSAINGQVVNINDSVGNIKQMKRIPSGRHGYSLHDTRLYSGGSNLDVMSQTSVTLEEELINNQYSQQAECDKAFRKPSGYLVKTSQRNKKDIAGFRNTPTLRTRLTSSASNHELTTFHANPGNPDTEKNARYKNSPAGKVIRSNSEAFLIYSSVKKDFQRNGSFNNHSHSTAAPPTFSRKTPQRNSLQKCKSLDDLLFSGKSLNNDNVKSSFSRLRARSLPNMSSEGTVKRVTSAVTRGRTVPRISSVPALLGSRGSTMYDVGKYGKGRSPYSDQHLPSHVQGLEQTSTSKLSFQKRPPVKPLPAHRLPRVASMPHPRLQRGADTRPEADNNNMGVKPSQSSRVERSYPKYWKVNRASPGPLRMASCRVQGIPESEPSLSRTESTSDMMFADSHQLSEDALYEIVKTRDGSQKLVKARSRPTTPMSVASPKAEPAPVPVPLHEQRSRYDFLSGAISAQLTNSRVESGYGDRPGNLSKGWWSDIWFLDDEVSGDEDDEGKEQDGRMEEETGQPDLSEIVDSKQQAYLMSTSHGKTSQQGQGRKVRKSPSSKVTFQQGSSSSEDSDDEEGKQDEEPQKDKQQCEKILQNFESKFGETHQNPEKLDSLPVQTFRPGDRRKYDFEAHNIIMPKYEFVSPFQGELAKLNLLEINRQKKNWRECVEEKVGTTESAMLDRLSMISRFTLETEEQENTQKERRKKTSVRRMATKVKETVNHQSAKLKERKCVPNCTTPMCIGECSSFSSSMSLRYSKNICPGCGEEMCAGLCSKTVYESRARTQAPLEEKKPRVFPSRPKSCPPCRATHVAKLLNANNILKASPASHHATYTRGQNMGNPKVPSPVKTPTPVDPKQSEQLRRIGLDPEHMAPKPKPEIPERIRPATACFRGSRGRAAIYPGKSYFSQRRDSITENNTIPKSTFIQTRRKIAEAAE